MMMTTNEPDGFERDGEHFRCSDCNYYVLDVMVKSHRCPTVVSLVRELAFGLTPEGAPLIADQPPPTPNASRPVWELVLYDMHGRDQVGRQRYGTPLQAFNGRKPLVDAYQEALDLVVYMRQEIEERRALAFRLRVALERVAYAEPPAAEAMRAAMKVALEVMEALEAPGGG